MYFNSALPWCRRALVALSFLAVCRRRHLLIVRCRRIRVDAVVHPGASIGAGWRGHSRIAAALSRHAQFVLHFEISGVRLRYPFRSQVILGCGYGACQLNGGTRYVHIDVACGESRFRLERTNQLGAQR